MSDRSPFPPVWVTNGLAESAIATRAPRPGYRFIADLTIHEERIEDAPPHCSLYELVPLTPGDAA